MTISVITRDPMAISALVLDRFVQMEELEGSAFARMNVMLTAVTSSQESYFDR